MAARFEVEQHAASFGHRIHQNNDDNHDEIKDNDHKHSATSSQRGRARNPSDKDENRHCANYYCGNYLCKSNIGKNLRIDRAVTGRRCPHSGEGEDFLTGQLNFFTETAVTSEQKVKKLFPRWEINRRAKG